MTTPSTKIRKNKDTKFGSVVEMAESKGVKYLVQIRCGKDFLHYEGFEKQEDAVEMYQMALEEGAVPRLFVLLGLGGLYGEAWPKKKE
jgi:hypothetical protein